MGLGKLPSRTRHQIVERLNGIRSHNSGHGTRRGTALPEEIFVIRLATFMVAPHCIAAHESSMAFRL